MAGHYTLVKSNTSMLYNVPITLQLKSAREGVKVHWSHVTLSDYNALYTGAEPSIAAAGGQANGSFTVPASTDEFSTISISGVESYEAGVSTRPLPSTT